MHGKTKYENIVRSLTARIRSGELPAGTRLPGQLALAKEYGVSAITANRALDELRKSGIVDRRQRSGSFVGACPRFIRQTVILTSFDQGDPEYWLRSYWDELCRINEDAGCSTAIIRKTDPGLADTIFNGQFSGGVILAGFEDRELIDQLEKHRIPYLILGVRALYGRFNVTENRMEAARLLLARICRDGAARVVFAGNLDQPNHREALQGCRMEAEYHQGMQLTVIDAGTQPTAGTLEKIAAFPYSPDAVLIMGGGLPFQLLPPLSRSLPGTKFGCFTENPAILNLKDIAYLAVYSQAQTAMMAATMLEDIASGRMTDATAKFAGVEISIPAL